jgi:hypothetical protein
MARKKAHTCNRLAPAAWSFSLIVKFTTVLYHTHEGDVLSNRIWALSQNDQSKRMVKSSCLKQVSDVLFLASSS